MPSRSGGGTILHLECLVDVLLGDRGNHAVLLEQAVLAEQPAPIDGPLTQGDVVGLGTCEVEQSRPQLIPTHRPDIDLHAFASEKGRLGLPGSEHLRRLGHLYHEGSHRTRVIGHDHDVDVPNGLGKAPNRATGNGHSHRGQASQAGGQGSSQRQRLDQRGAPILAVKAETLDCLPDLLLGDLPHPRKLTQTLRTRSRLEAHRCPRHPDRCGAA